ncbi:MAG: right-handed parallel beta-helix repeat-containing protein [Bacteroidota bacterium]
MKQLLLSLALVAGFSAFAQTTISNKEEVSGTWKKSKSPYIIEGEAIIPEGKTLTIKAGVVVKFKTGEGRDYDMDDFNLGFLRVNGKIIAKGKPSKRILFTGNGSGFWGNIYVNSPDQNHVFENCVVEKAYYIRKVIPTDNGTGAITFNKSTGIVKNCILANNGWTGLNCKNGASPTISNCVIYNNEYGLESNTRSTPTIENTIIWNNGTTFYINGSSAPKIGYCFIGEDKLPEGITDQGGNILGKNPQFEDAMIGNFKLKQESPCRKVGKGGKNIGLE